MNNLVVLSIRAGRELRLFWLVYKYLDNTMFQQADINLTEETVL